MTLTPSGSGFRVAAAMIDNIAVLVVNRNTAMGLALRARIWRDHLVPFPSHSQQGFLTELCSICSILIRNGFPLTSNFTPVPWQLEQDCFLFGFGMHRLCARPPWTIVRVPVLAQ